MSVAQLLSLVGVLFALLVALVGVIYRALSDRIGKLEGANNAAVLQSRVDTLAAEVAKLEGRFEQRGRDKDKFDYEWRHGQYVSDITAINMQLLPLVQRVESMDDRLGSLHEWKHHVGESYLPRAVDEHERRLNRLDARVFNGHRREDE